MQALRTRAAARGSVWGSFVKRPSTAAGAPPPPPCGSPGTPRVLEPVNRVGKSCGDRWNVPRHARTETRAAVVGGTEDWVLPSAEDSFDDADDDSFPQFNIACIDGEANIDVEVLDARTARVTVSEAEDRPGLLRDIAHAVDKLDLAIANATITTTEDGVQNTFLVKVKKGSEADLMDRAYFYDEDGLVCETVLEKVQDTILVEAIASWDLHHEVNSEEEQRIIEPCVQVMKFERCGREDVVLRIEATDRPGLLGTLTTRLSRLGVHIRTAEVHTKYGCVYNKFVLNKPEGVILESIRLEARKAVESDDVSH